MFRICLRLTGLEQLNLSQSVFFRQNLQRVNNRFCTSSSEEEMELSAVVKSLQSFAPKSLAESWDNVGLLVNNLLKYFLKFCLEVRNRPVVYNCFFAESSQAKSHRCDVVPHAV